MNTNKSPKLIPNVASGEVRKSRTGPSPREPNSDCLPSTPGAPISGQPSFVIAVDVPPIASQRRGSSARRDTHRHSQDGNSTTHPPRQLNRDARPREASAPFANRPCASCRRSGGLQIDCGGPWIAGGQRIEHDEEIDARGARDKGRRTDGEIGMSDDDGRHGGARR